MSQVRFGVQINGKRYAARDTGRHSYTGAMWCEHAVWDEPEGVVWLPHLEGEMMKPFEGPDDEWEKLIDGGKHLWNE